MMIPEHLEVVEYQVVSEEMVDEYLKDGWVLYGNGYLFSSKAEPFLCVQPMVKVREKAKTRAWPPPLTSIHQMTPEQQNAFTGKAGDVVTGSGWKNPYEGGEENQLCSSEIKMQVGDGLVVHCIEEPMSDDVANKLAEAILDGRLDCTKPAEVIGQLDPRHPPLWPPLDTDTGPLDMTEKMLISLAGIVTPEQWEAIYEALGKTEGRAIAEELKKHLGVNTESPDQK